MPSKKDINTKNTIDRNLRKEAKKIKKNYRHKYGLKKIRIYATKYCHEGTWHISLWYINRDNDSRPEVYAYF